MSKILELRTKRNTLWEQTKDFLEKNRGENGLVKAEAVEQYNKMAQEVKDLGAEIERLEQQAQIEAQLSAPTSSPVHADPKSGAKKDVKPTATAEYAENFWNMIRNRGHYGEVRNALSVGEDTEGGFTVPDEFEKKLVEALEENNIFRGMATVIRTSSGTRKIPIAEDTGEASWIDEGEEIPESDTTFGQTMLSAYKLGTMIKISNELLNDSAFDLATYIARRFGVRMGNAEERAFITGDGVGKPLGLLAETGGAKVGVTAAQKDAVTFDEIFKLYYALKAPYRKKAQFLCNEALVLQLMTIKDNNGNYIWKPGLEIGKPDTLLNRPLKTSAFMPEIKGGSKVMAFGDYSYYWVADRQNRTFRRLNELYVVNNNSGYEGDLEIALIPESFLTDIMHEELDGNGVLAENANVELEHFAFLFEFDGDQRHIRHVLYNCVASRPSIEGETNEDSKEVKTDTLNLQATPLANGYVKAKTGTNTTDDVYNKWYDAVYEPQAEAVDTEDTSHTEEPQG